MRGGVDGVVSVGSPIFEEVWFAIDTNSFMALFALMGSCTV